jgi:hypothetical protein
VEDEVQVPNESQSTEPSGGSDGPYERSEVRRDSLREIIEAREGEAEGDRWGDAPEDDGSPRVEGGEDVDPEGEQPEGETADGEGDGEYGSDSKGRARRDRDEARQERDAAYAERDTFKGKAEEAASVAWELHTENTELSDRVKVTEAELAYFKDENAELRQMLLEKVGYQPPAERDQLRQQKLENLKYQLAEERRTEMAKFQQEQAQTVAQNEQVEGLRASITEVSKEAGVDFGDLLAFAVQRGAKNPSADELRRMAKVVKAASSQDADKAIAQQEKNEAAAVPVRTMGQRSRGAPQGDEAEVKANKRRSWLGQRLAREGRLN